MGTLKEILDCGLECMLSTQTEESACFDLGAIYGLYRDNGKENGNYYLGSRVWGQMCPPHKSAMNHTETPPRESRWRFETRLRV